MINLKCLSFSPVGIRHGFAQGLFPYCKFQLESLIWKCEDGTNHNYLVAFLRTQTGLRHLEVGEPADGADMTWLPNDVCANLISVASGHDSLGGLDQRSQVVALKTNICQYVVGNRLLNFSEAQRASRQRIKYLALSMDSHFRGDVARIFPNIVLLELHCWDVEVCRMANYYTST